jgi:hypothetical protein
LTADYLSTIMKHWDAINLLIDTECIQDLNPHRYARVGDTLDASTRARRCQSHLIECILGENFTPADAMAPLDDDDFEMIPPEETYGQFAAAILMGSMDFLGLLRYAAKDPRTKDLPLCKAAAAEMTDWSLAAYSCPGLLSLAPKLGARADEALDATDEYPVNLPITDAEFAMLDGTLRPIYGEMAALLENHAHDFAAICQALWNEQKNSAVIPATRKQYDWRTLFNRAQRRQLHDLLVPIQKRVKKTGKPALFLRDDRNSDAFREKYDSMLPACEPWMRQLGHEPEDVFYGLLSNLPLAELAS